MRVAAGHIVLVLLFATACGTGSDVAEPSAAERTPVPQESTERVFPFGDPTVIDTVRIDDPTFWPVKLEVLDSGELLASDRGSIQAVRLSAEGEILARYGSGVGEGPGEHQGIDLLGQLSDGTVWTWDARNRRINLFEAGGSFAGTVGPESAASIAIALGFEEFVGVSLMSPNPFVAFDGSGRVSKRWGWFIDDPAPNALPFVGQLQGLQDGAGFVYIPQFAGRLYVYDDDGSLLWHRSVIDHIDVPTVTSGSLTFGEEGPSAQHFPLNVDGNDIHLSVISRNYENFYIDTYDVASGDYRYSLNYNAGRGCALLSVSGDVLYMSCDAQIVRFRIPER